jgi:hypothetical protein
MDNWNEGEGKSLEFSFLDGEEVKYMWQYDGKLYIRSTLDRVWVSTNTKMPYLDMIEITDIKK